MKNTIRTQSNGNAEPVEANAATHRAQGLPQPCNSIESPSATKDSAKTVAGSISPAVAKELAIFEDARVSQAVEALEGGRKLLELIPVRRPQKTTWFKSHPANEYWYRAFLLEDERTGDLYFLSRPVWEALVELGEKAIVRKLLVPTLSRNNVLSLWPIALGVDGTFSSWSESAVTAAIAARTDWVRITSNRELGGYEIKTRPSDGVEPQWPNLNVSELLRVAFKGRVVTSIDHPVVRDLRGETVSQSGDGRLDALLGGRAN